MPLLQTLQKNRDAIVFLAILAAVCVPLGRAVSSYQDHFVYREFEQSLVKGTSYLQGSHIVSEYRYQISKSSSVADIHVLISKELATDMAAEAHPLYFCASSQKQGCNNSSWKPYNFYVSSYSKTTTGYNSKGKYASQDNNPAVPYLSKNPDRSQIVCAMQQVNSSSAYGICINPTSGDIWYHEYRGYTP